MTSAATARHARSATRGRDGRDAGVASILTTAVGLLVTWMLCVVVAASVLVVDGVGRTRQAADLVALALLSGSPLAGGDGEPAVAAARSGAAANGMELRQVDLAGWPLAVRVAVEPAAQATTGPLAGLVDRALPARSGAAVLVPPS